MEVVEEVGSLSAGKRLEMEKREFPNWVQKEIFKGLGVLVCKEKMQEEEEEEEEIFGDDEGRVGDGDGRHWASF
ncbi:hypothetical protein V2A60_006042 [Cordyceps javanica]